MTRCPSFLRILDQRAAVTRFPVLDPRGAGVTILIRKLMKNGTALAMPLEETFVGLGAYTVFRLRANPIPPASASKIKVDGSGIVFTVMLSIAAS